MAKKIEITGKTRGFGLGFGIGYRVDVFLDGPQTGDLFSDRTTPAVIDKWYKDSAADKLTTIIKPQELVKAVYNRLLHYDKVDLVNLLPHLLRHLPEEVRDILFCSENCRRISPKVYEEIGSCRPHLRHLIQPMNASRYLYPLLLEEMEQASGASETDIIYNKVSMEALSVLFPILFNAAEDELKPIIVEGLSKALHVAKKDKEFFGPLRDPDLNRVVIRNDKAPPSNHIKSNGRTIIVESDEGPVVAFQGREFMAKNIHFHPLDRKNMRGQKDGSSEYRVFESEEAWRKNKDPVRGTLDSECVGELHTICVSPDNHALALSAMIKIGEHNPKFQNYLDVVKQAHGDTILEADHPVSTQTLPFNPLQWYGSQSFTADGLPLAPFSSLYPQISGLTIINGEARPGKHNGVFGQGVHVVHLREPVTISQQQYEYLCKLQPALDQLSKKSFVHPIGIHQARWDQIDRRKGLPPPGQRR